MRHIVYALPGSDTVWIARPIRNTHPPEDHLTEAEIEQRAWDRLPADAIEPRFVDEAEVPVDRTFRDAWKPDLTVDMDKARAIHKDRMRAGRAPLMAALDVEYQRADERGDAEAKTAVAKRKQALRDVTADPAIAKARTPDDLKAVWPTALD